MTDERRIHRRISHPLEATWTGASGATRCRIGDVSLGGCYVQTLSVPGKGEITTISFTINDRRFVLKAQVVYAEPSMGFAARFEPMSEADQESLSRAIETL